MVALLRSADASAQLTELSEEWTSMHDVTGQLIAVLCPDPHALTDAGNPATQPAPDSVAACAARYELRLLAGDHGPLDRCFGSSVHRDHAQGRASAVPPGPPSEHRSAWTEAASRCASYFGITEAQIPAVLLLSFAESTAVLVQLRARSAASLYDLCKQVAANLGFTKRVAELTAHARGLRRRQQDLHQLVARYGMSYRPWWSRVPPLLGEQLSYEMTDELQAQYDGLDRHLCLVEEVDPVLVDRWRADLARLLSDGTVEQTYEQLFAIRAAVIRSQDRPKWRKLATKVNKAIASTDRIVLDQHEHFWQLDQADPIAALYRRAEAERERWQTDRDRATAEAQEELRQIDDELTRNTRELADIRPRTESEPGLAEATIAAARDLLGRATTHSVEGTDSLAGYTVRVIQPTGEAPGEREDNIDNSVSGTVAGSVLQARNITGDVHIHHPGLWARARRWFS